MKKSELSKKISLHLLAEKGDLVGLKAFGSHMKGLEETDDGDFTVLMRAVKSPLASVDTLRYLIAQGANVNACRVAAKYRPTESVLGIAVKEASLEKIQCLIEAGADVNFVSSFNESILLKAAQRKVLESEAEKGAILEYLVSVGAPLDIQNGYGESVVSVLSSRGKFGHLKSILEKGASSSALNWTPLFFSVAFGTLVEVRAQRITPETLESRDHIQRTPFLVAVHRGNTEIAEYLLEKGCDPSAVGNDGKLAFEYAIGNGHVSMVRWLIGQGFDVEVTDDHGKFPLSIAVNNPGCFAALFSAGANPNRLDNNGEPLIKNASNLEVIELLVKAGQDLSEIPSESRAKMFGEADRQVLNVTKKQFHAYRTRKFGKQNPETMNNPFWDEMVRLRLDAMLASMQFEDDDVDAPVWCFKRFGQSITRLPDGRYVEVGGEHEDWYSPDFCIYNDVVVHKPDGSFELFGYPKEVFPPTDFHSATLVGHYLYIIGNLGYGESRQAGETPVYRLDCNTWAIEKIKSRGDNPRWIHKHKAKLLNSDQIEITEGQIFEGAGKDFTKNKEKFLFDLQTFTWTKVA